MHRPTTRFFIYCAVGCALLASPSLALAQNYTWSAAGGGSWIDSTNWGALPGDYPSSSFTRATFSTPGHAADMTVTLDGAITLRRLIFNSNQTGSVTIAPGIGGTLTFDDPETGQPTLNVVSGSGNHAVNANMAILGPIAHKWGIGGTQVLAMNGNISGTQSLVKLDTGTLLLNGSNTYTGPTIVSAGTLGGSGSIASAVSVAVGATLAAGASSTAPTMTLNGGLTLSGRTLVKLFANDAVGRITLTSGTATLNGGPLELAFGSGDTVESFRLGGSRSYTIIDAPDGQLNGTFGGFDFTTAEFAPTEWAVVYDNPSGNVVLNFTPVPEPATVLGVAAAGLLAAWRVRRRAQFSGI